MTEIILWLISGLLGVIAILIGVVWNMINTKMDQMMVANNMFIEEIVEIKENIAALFAWQKSQEKRLDKLEK